LYEVSAQRGVKTGSFREGENPRPTKRDSGFGGTYFSVLPKTLSGIYLVEISLFEVCLGVSLRSFHSLVCLVEIYPFGISL
jgi:hypothetical protein